MKLYFAYVSYRFHKHSRRFRQVWLEWRLPKINLEQVQVVSEKLKSSKASAVISEVLELFLERDKHVQLDTLICGKTFSRREHVFQKKGNADAKGSWDLAELHRQ